MRLDWTECHCWYGYWNIFDPEVTACGVCWSIENLWFVFSIWNECSHLYAKHFQSFDLRYLVKTVFVLKLKAWTSSAYRFFAMNVITFNVKKNDIFFLHWVFIVIFWIFFEKKPQPKVDHEYWWKNFTNKLLTKSHDKISSY